MGYFSSVIAILGTLRPARSSIPERDRQLHEPSHRRRRAPRAIHSGARRGPGLSPRSPSPYPVLGNMTFAVRTRGDSNSRECVVTAVLSSAFSPAPGPAPRSARSGYWKPDVAECACARSGPAPALGARYHFPLPGPGDPLSAQAQWETTVPRPSRGLCSDNRSPARV